jgi:hypothetical protein
VDEKENNTLPITARSTIIARNQTYDSLIGGVSNATEIR